MADERDPVEAAAGGSMDLYDVATWEPRSRLDRLAIRVYGGLVRTVRTAVILLALVIMVVQFVFSGLAAIANPAIGAFILLSVVPALAITLYVWRSDVMEREPLKLLVVTFLLGILFAGFAAILNTLAQPAFQYIPIVGMPLFFYLVVAPIEETVKWLAVRLHAYRHGTFGTVLDGAVYGAVAGLGFATIENSLYIGQQYMTAMQQAGGAAPEPVAAALGTAAVRSFAGPGHVIYSAFAGYYLGLAKFNREDAGPIVVKGLLIAAFIHGTYNTLVGIVPGLVGIAYPGVPTAAVFIGFVIVYDGIFGYALYRKISRYRTAFVDSGAERRADVEADLEDVSESVETAGEGVTDLGDDE
ncbi:MAG: PrsW family intramembrane metalloprotease [Halobacteriales archaeon]